MKHPPPKQVFTMFESVTDFHVYTTGWL